MVTCNLSIIALHFPSKQTFSGIFTEAGKAPNIIPDRAQLLYYFRATDKRDLKVLLEQAEQCFQAGAAATGCTVEISEVLFEVICLFMCNLNLYFVT